MVFNKRMQRKLKVKIYKTIIRPVWSRSIMSTKNEVEIFGNNINENVEADRGCDAKTQETEK